MPGFRAVCDPPAGALAVHVVGYRHDLGGVTRAKAGLPHWFCSVFHQTTPVLHDGAWIEAPAGSVIINAPGTPILQGQDGAWFRSWLRFDGDNIPGLLGRCGLQAGRLYRVTDTELHDRWVLAIHAECSHPLGAEPQTVRDLCCCWWRSIARDCRVPAVPTAVRAARERIEQHYRDALTLDGLATAVGLSRATLCRNFRRAYHSTPMRYARRLRLDHAADLLRSTESSVGAIATASGFRDVYYFSRAFREAYGCTPTAWRKGPE